MQEPQQPRELNPVPFVAALLVVAVAVVLGYLFLRPDDSGELLRPERLEVVDDDTIRAVGTLGTPCHEVRRAQVDMDEDTIFVELVVVEQLDDDEACIQVVQPIEAEITLPAAISGREVRPGVGRFHIPCEAVGSDGGVRTYTCTSGR